MGLPIKLQADEELVVVKKRHPVYVVMKAVVAIVIAGLLIWGIWWISSTTDSAGPIWPWLYVVVIVGAVVYLGVLAYRFYNDLWIVTNQRLVDSLKRTPINHQLSSTDLINVQDIDVSKRGIMATAFNFGDVICQTASTDGSFIFIGVGDPAGLMEMLDRLRDEARRQSGKAIGQAVGEAASARQAQGTP